MTEMEVEEREDSWSEFILKNMESLYIDLIVKREENIESWK